MEEIELVLGAFSSIDERPDEDAMISVLKLVLYIGHRIDNEMRECKSLGEDL